MPEAKVTTNADHFMIVSFTKDAEQEIHDDILPLSTFVLGRRTYYLSGEGIEAMLAYEHDDRFSFSDDAVTMLDNAAGGVSVTATNTPRIAIGYETNFYSVQIIDQSMRDKFHETIQNTAVVSFDPKTHIYSFLRPAQAREVSEIFKLDGVFCDPGIMEEIQSEADFVAVDHSKDISAGIGQLSDKLYDYQRDGVEFIIANRNVLVADEPGLGKTIMSVTSILNDRANNLPCLVICPASLKENWAKEWQQWWKVASPDSPPLNIEIISGHGVSGQKRQKKNLPPHRDIYIINYEIIDGERGWLDQLIAVGFKSIILDESHYVKNPKAKRTKSAIQLSKTLPEDGLRILLSGTPVINRPAELIPQLMVIDRLKDFGGWKEFMKRYAGTFVSSGKRGYWDTSRPHALDELNELLQRRCMIRRKKGEVLTDLPEILPRAFVTVGIPNITEYKEAEKDIIEWLKNEYPDDPTRASAAERAKAIVKLNILRQLTSAGKSHISLDWIENFLESGKKLIVFAYFKDAQQIIFDEFADDGAVRIAGGASKGSTQAAVDRFQTDPSARLLVASLGAGGVGHTLTAASDVLFIDYGWNPAAMEQAESRSHRIGQTEKVTPWYLHDDNTIDRYMQNVIENKRLAVGTIVDGLEQTTDSAMDFVIDGLVNG